MADPLAPSDPPSAAMPAAGPASVGEAGDARARLVAAGIEAFGTTGYDAASIRAIAKAANVNIAGVSYHFGGKDGLYRACAEFIATTVHTRLTARIADIGPLDRLTPEAAAAGALVMVRGFVQTLLGEPRMDRVARFIIREQMDPTPVFAILYEGIMRPLHERFCALWAIATGADADAEETLAKAFAIVGQIIVFRVGRATVLSRFGWSDLGPDEARLIEETVVANVAALMAAETDKNRATARASDKD